jgi:hypothetical protein
LDPIHQFSQKVNKSKKVRKALACLILVNAVMLGFFTAYLKNMQYAWATFVGGIFLLELFFKLAAEGFHPWRHFLSYCGDIPRSVRIDRVFDATIIILGWGISPMVLVCRLGLVGYALNSKSLRLPALTLISASEVLLYAIALFAWVIFAFACCGVVLFSTNDPQHYGALDKAVFTHLRMTTLDDWSDIWLMNQLGCDKFLNDILPEDCVEPFAQPVISCVFFPAYVLLTSYIGMNLLTAIVVTSNEDVVEEMAIETDHRKKIATVKRQFGLSGAQILKTKAIFNLLDFDGSKELDIIELQLALDQAFISLQRTSVIRMMRYLDPTWTEGRGVNFPSFLRFFVTIAECKNSNFLTLPELLAGFRIVAILKKRVKLRKVRYNKAVADHLVSGERFFREFLNIHSHDGHGAMMQHEILKHEASRHKLFTLARNNECHEMTAMEDATRGLVGKWQLLTQEGESGLRKAINSGDKEWMENESILVLQRRWRGYQIRHKLVLHKQNVCVQDEDLAGLEHHAAGISPGRSSYRNLECLVGAAGMSPNNPSRSLSAPSSSPLNPSRSLSAPSSSPHNPSRSASALNSMVRADNSTQQRLPPRVGKNHREQPSRGAPTVVLPPDPPPKAVLATSGSSRGAPTAVLPLELPPAPAVANLDDIPDDLQGGHHRFLI